MGTVQAITQHAIDLYMARSGTKKPHRGIEKLFRVSDNAIPIGRNRYYARGWIIVVVAGVIKTVYRPRTREQMDAINKATDERRKHI